MMVGIYKKSICLFLNEIKTVSEYGVFARKFIPKRTQFGPLEGKIIPVSAVKREESALSFFVEGLNGSTIALDTSDESKLLVFV